MLFAGFSEGLGSQRAIARKCSDSLSVQEFLGVASSKAAPGHSSMTYIRRRVPTEVYELGFQMVLDIARQKGMLPGKNLTVESTTLEANTAMKSMVDGVSQTTWQQYLMRLAKAAGIENPTADDLRRTDRNHKGKKVSNGTWKSPSDPDSRIARMKDGTTHFAYKAGHAVDVQSGLIVPAQVYQANDPDTDAVVVIATTARENLKTVNSKHTGEDVLGDKGYHRAKTIDLLESEPEMRTCIPEPRTAHKRVCTNKRPELKKSRARTPRGCFGNASPCDNGARGRSASFS